MAQTLNSILAERRRIQHDQKTQIRRISAVLAKEGSEDRTPAESRNVQIACGGREARAGGAVLQARRLSAITACPGESGPAARAAFRSMAPEPGLWDHRGDKPSKRRRRGSARP